MLAEINDVRQIEGQGFRRWFTDQDFDLIVWYTDERQIIGFQLCYDKEHKERALTWTRAEGYSHNKVDDGEWPRGHNNMTPILVPDGIFENNLVAGRFLKAAADIEPVIVRLVFDTLQAFPGGTAVRE